MPTPGSATKGRARTFSAREILDRPIEIMREIEDLAASLGDDEVLVCQAPSCPQPVDRWMRASGLELMADEATDGVRVAVFRRARRNIRPADRLDPGP